MRRQISPALVISCLALFVALSGTGYAISQLPKNSVGTAQLKKGAVTSVKVKDGSLLSQDFKASERAALKGDKGEQGDKGDTGVAGAVGASGASGAAVFSGGIYALGVAGTGLTYYTRAPVSGIVNFNDGLTTAEVASLSPARAIRVRDLSADVAVDVPEGGAVRVRFVVNPPAGYSDSANPTELGCTINGTAAITDKSCTSDAMVAVPAGSVIFVRVEVEGGDLVATNPLRAHWGMTVEPAS